MTKKSAYGVFTLLLSSSLSAQIRTNTTILQRSAALQAAKEKTDFQQLLTLSTKNGWKLMLRTQRGLRILRGVDVFGYPIYTSTENTLVSAATIGTNQLWASGSLGLSLSGSSAAMNGMLAIWDGGKVRATHVEMAGRVNQVDGAATNEDHSTHVAGIMMGAGINPLARGMSYGVQQLKAYDFNNDLSEMFAAGSGLLVSNHSYSTVSGWNYNDKESRWEFSGRSGENEDYKFGYYDNDAQIWDSIAYNAPNYLIVKAAGNNRNQNGPAVGANYWRYNSSGQMTNAGARPAGISDNNGYDIIPTYGTAKNILTVGAVQPLANGYSQPSDVVISSFSSWGPTDDGRIKPDVVADGVNVLSAIATSDNSYGNLSGTSMASPAVAGSAFLLQEYYSQLHNDFMRSATLKGLIIHTAEEAGPAGPDYQFGWGLMNTGKAAAVIKANNGNGHFIEQNILTNGGTYTKNIISTGTGPLVVTICWTDPKGTVDNANVMNNPALKLVNDLDMRITGNSNTYAPWVLNPAAPSSAATKGDNFRDNVEKIEIPNTVANTTYTITITHKGTLARGSQAYSLIISDYSAIAAPAIDFAATGLATPYISNCPADSQLVSIKIKNTGTTDKKNIPVTTVISNGINTIKTLTAIYPDTIHAGQELVYTYPARFHAAANTTYTFTTTVNFSGDLNSANNQQVTTIAAGGAGGNPTDAIANVCNNKATLKATAPNGGQIFWYENATATTPIVAGKDTFTTIIPSNLIYYTAVNDAPVNVGAANKSISASGNYAALPSVYINFTTYTPLTIESVRLYIGHSGTMTFTVGKPVDATHYLPVSSVTIPVYATLSGSSDPGGIFLLNLAVPSSGDYRLYLSCADGATIFYNNGINTNPYPYTTSNVFSLTGNSGDDGNGGNFQRFYLGLYDIGLKHYGCASARIPVQATSCGEVTGITIGANPNDGEFRLYIPKPISGTLLISIVNMLGQRVYTNRYTTSSGDLFAQTIDARSLQSGVYLLELNYGGKRYTRKLVIRNR